MVKKKLFESTAWGGTIGHCSFSSWFGARVIACSNSTIIRLLVFRAITPKIGYKCTILSTLLHAAWSMTIIALPLLDNGCTNIYFSSEFRVDETMDTRLPPIQL